MHDIENMNDQNKILNQTCNYTNLKYLQFLKNHKQTKS